MAEPYVFLGRVIERTPEFVTLKLVFFWTDNRWLLHPGFWTLHIDHSSQDALAQLHADMAQIRSAFAEHPRCARVWSGALRGAWAAVMDMVAMARDGPFEACCVDLARRAPAAFWPVFWAHFMRGEGEQQRLHAAFFAGLRPLARGRVPRESLAQTLQHYQDRSCFRQPWIHAVLDALRWDIEYTPGRDAPQWRVVERPPDVAACA